MWHRTSDSDLRCEENSLEAAGLLLSTSSQRSPSECCAVGDSKDTSLRLGRQLSDHPDNLPPGGASSDLPSITTSEELSSLSRNDSQPFGSHQMDNSFDSVLETSQSDHISLSFECGQVAAADSERTDESQIDEATMSLDSNLSPLSLSSSVFVVGSLTADADHSSSVVTCSSVSPAVDAPLPDYALAGDSCISQPGVEAVVGSGQVTPVGCTQSPGSDVNQTECAEDATDVQAEMPARVKNEISPTLPVMSDQQPSASVLSSEMCTQQTVIELLPKLDAKSSENNDNVNTNLPSPESSGSVFEDVGGAAVTVGACNDIDNSSTIQDVSQNRPLTCRPSPCRTLSVHRIVRRHTLGGTGDLQFVIARDLTLPQSPPPSGDELRIPVLPPAISDRMSAWQRLQPAVKDPLPDIGAWLAQHRQLHYGSSSSSPALFVGEVALKPTAIAYSSVAPHVEC
jgi:hypothetical protein